MPSVAITKSDSHITASIITDRGDVLYRTSSRLPEPTGPKRFNYSSLFAMRRRITRYAIQHGIILGD